MTIPYEAVIMNLRSLSDGKTITQKIRSLIDSSKAIVRCVDEYHNPPLFHDPIEEFEGKFFLIFFLIFS